MAISNCVSEAHPLSLTEEMILNEEEKISIIEHHFGKILETLGLDLKDDSIQRTPSRVAKMYVQELFKGLNEGDFPAISTQPNSFNYKEMLIETKISINSTCEHHFVPILGQCHIAYIPKGEIIGLSKLNRVAQYFAKRPQVQERLTRQIKESLVEILGTEDVAVVVDAIHLCVRIRGVQDKDSMTRTYDLGGKFETEPYRQELFSSIPRTTDLSL